MHICIHRYIYLYVYTEIISRRRGHGSGRESTEYLLWACERTWERRGVGGEEREGKRDDTVKKSGWLRMRK